MRVRIETERLILRPFGPEAMQGIIDHISKTRKALGRNTLLLIVRKSRGSFDRYRIRSF